MDSIIQPRSFGTHDGSFHADEATACSLLLLFNRIDRDQIVRTRDVKRLAQCEYVCDVGGLYDPSKRRFDHHQAEYKGSMSSAGMILLYLKMEGDIDSCFYEYLNKALIMGVDAHDNGVAHLEPGTCSFSQVVSNFLPIEYDVESHVMFDAFLTAVDFIVGHLRRLSERYAYTFQCRSIVQEKMKEGGYALFFDASIPWMESFFELGGDVHPAQFIVMPAGEHWKLRGIPPSLSERMKVRRPLPASWAGLHSEELKKRSGIEGAIFCHKGLFISIWETKEDAIRALHLALDRS